MIIGLMLMILLGLVVKVQEGECCGAAGPSLDDKCEANIPAPPKEVRETRRGTKILRWSGSGRQK